MSESNRQERYFTELDALRGLAALSVFFSHMIGFIPDSNILNFFQKSIFHIFWDGASAVVLFFVLSGFVLSRGFIATSTIPNYPSFLVRRVFRLYPAYWFALAIAIGLQMIYQPQGMAELSQWAQSLWIEPNTLVITLQHATMVLKTNTHAIDPVVWSLIVEMRMSLLVPLIIFAVVRWDNPLAHTLVAVASIITCMMVQPFSLAFLPLFVFGVLLGKYYQRLADFIAALGPVKLWLLILFFTCLYENRWVLNFHEVEQVKNILTGLASTFLIVLVIGKKPFAAFLNAPVFQFLGRISYSFYLLHLPILLIATSYLYPLTNSLLISSFAALLATFGLSELVYRYLEHPCILLGRRVAARFGRRVVPALP